MQDLARMSELQLQNVAEFKVWNEHGSVEWIGQTDLTYVNLEDIVTI